MLEVLRMVAAWLAHATYGVDAMLTAASYDGSDVKPTGTLAVGDESQNAKAAVGRYPGDWSIAVQLQPVEDLIQQAATHTHDMNIPLLIRLNRTDSDAAAATRDLLYTLRAVRQSLDQLNNDANATAVAARTRNQVQMSHIESTGGALTREDIADNVVTAAIAVTIKARDLVA